MLYGRRRVISKSTRLRFKKMKKYKWGGNRTKIAIYPSHEEWAIKNGYRDNATLNSKNTVSFKDGAER